MKILFFFTSFRQLEENKYQVKIFEKQLNQMKIPESNLQIDIILHNNNSEYNQQMITESWDMERFKKIKYINKIHVIHTKKNIGYLWGAQEALSDNFYLFKSYDFVIHLNSNIFITKLYLVIDYISRQKNNNIIFWVNKFTKYGGGFKTNFTIFRPLINIYKNYNNTDFKLKLQPRIIPEKLLEYSIKINKLAFIILPKIFIPQSDLCYLENILNLSNSNYFEKYIIFHIHNLDNLGKIKF
jgi:hypothetical protein